MGSVSGESVTERAGDRRGELEARIERLGHLRGLTVRERQVACLVVRAYSNPQIAERLSISPETVKTHVARVLAKAGAASRGELAMLVWSVPIGSVGERSAIPTMSDGSSAIGERGSNGARRGAGSKPASQRRTR